ncbi:MAG: phosphoribosylformylglycinamidine synthase, partial [Deltaproteobacteria bacterium]
RQEMGGSEYFGEIGLRAGRPPSPSLSENLELYRKLHQAIWEGYVASCHDASDGGLGVALAETAFAGRLGMEVDLRAVPCEGDLRDDVILFSESCGRFVVTVAPEKSGGFERLMKDLPAAKVGVVTNEQRLAVKGSSGKVVVDMDTERLRQAWQRPLAF